MPTAYLLNSVSSKNLNPQYTSALDNWMHLTTDVFETVVIFYLSFKLFLRNEKKSNIDFSSLKGAR